MVFAVVKLFTSNVYRGNDDGRLAHECNKPLRGIRCMYTVPASPPFVENFSFYIGAGCGTVGNKHKYRYGFDTISNIYCTVTDVIIILMIVCAVLCVVVIGQTTV